MRSQSIVCIHSSNHALQLYEVPVGKTDFLIDTDLYLAVLANNDALQLSRGNSLFAATVIEVILNKAGNILLHC